MEHSHTKQEFLSAYDMYADAIFRHCFFKVSDREVARDITQDVFTKTWQYLSDNKPVLNMKAFLYKVAGNLVIDYYRKRKTDSLDLKIDEGVQFASEEVMGGQNAEIGIVIEALQKLPENYREVMRLRYVDDLTPGEIAEITGQSENAVSVKIHRGLEKLKHILHI